MSRYFFVLSIVLSALSTVLTAQTNTDSLWSVWNNTTFQDTIRLNALHHLSSHYIHYDPDSARWIAQKQFAFAKERTLVKWQARALNSLGLSYRFQSHYAKALQYYQQSIFLLEKAGDRNYMAAVYGNMGDIYRLQGNFPKAIDCITKCLALAEETGDLKKAADAYVSIATVYYEDPGNIVKTLEYLEKARAGYEALKDEQGLSLAYGNLSAAYLDQNELEKALYFTEKSLAVQKKLGDQHGAATSLYNRAIIYSKQGDFRDAWLDFERVIEIFQKMGDQEGLADTYNGMALIWIEQKRFPAAIQMCEKALQIAHKIGSPNLRAVDACHCLYEAYHAQGNYKQALHYLEQYVAAKDSLQQNETAQKLKRMEIERQTVADSLGREKEKFQIELKHQYALRQKDKTVGMLIAAGLGMLTFALAFWVRMLYFRRRSQQLQARSDELSRQQLLNEISLLRTQVNPHFLFNSLSILSSLVHTDANLSEKFIEQLSRSYRYILEQKEQSLVTLRTELEFIKSYSFLLKIRFENKLDLKVELADEILDRFKIAPLTLQLLVENAVKHNRMSLKEPLVITVYLENPQTLVVKNPLQPRVTPVLSTGVGLQNIIDRYALLTERRVWAGETEDNFVVKVPLLS